MGFLEVNEPLEYDSLVKIVEKVRTKAINQFIYCMQGNYDRFDHELFFGDEVEFMIVKLDDENRRVQIALIASDVISAIKQDDKVIGQPEYASYMVEMISSNPRKVELSSLLEIQDSLKHKREVLQKTIESLGYSNCYVVQLTSFPRLGCDDTIAYLEGSKITTSRDCARSIFLPDGVITYHPRFISFTKNIRLRREAKVCIFAPIYKDINTRIGSISEDIPIGVEIRASTLIQNHELAANLPDPMTRMGVYLDESLSKNISKIIERGGSYKKITSIDRIEIPVSKYKSFDDLFYTSNLSGLILVSESDCVYCPFSPCEFRNKLEIVNRQWIQTASESGNEDPIPGYIYMDAMCFGMGMCCYQNTFACPTMDDARYIHDQFLAIAPYFLALTASCPIFRGLLSETDTRWDVLSQSVDDRSESDCLYMPKSRFSCNSLYISNRDILMKNYFKYNDVLLPTNVEIYDKCVDVGVDPILARHISHIFTRDPICVFKSTEDSDLEENINLNEFQAFQSVNWNLVRFKLPSWSKVPDRGEIGYRIEFRCPEMQLTDFENSAVSAVLLVLVNMITKREFEYYLPISILEENLKRSASQSAVSCARFYRPKMVNGQYSVEEATLSQILFDDDGIFTRCINFVRDEVGSGDVLNTFQRYMELFKLRCNGKLPTSAKFIRDYIINHELYKHDSIVSDQIAYDLCKISIELHSGNNPIIYKLLGDLARFN